MHPCTASLAATNPTIITFAPSLPSPPTTLHTSSAAGLPTDNDTVYCPDSQPSCYFYSYTTDPYATALSKCAAMGGDVVSWNSAAEQLAVETYFWLVRSSAGQVAVGCLKAAASVALTWELRLSWCSMQHAAIYHSLAVEM